MTGNINYKKQEITRYASQLEQFVLTNLQPKDTKADIACI